MINIIIPAYNCEKWIGQCLDSFLAQTYQEFRIIVVDDGSTDGTLEILKKYQGKLCNLEILTQKNQGPAAARNAGLELAPNFLEELVGLMDDNVALVSCGFRWQKRTQKHFKNKKTQVLSFDKVDGLCQLFIDRYVNCTLWNKLLKMDFVKDLCFDAKLFLAEDTTFMIEYLTNLPENCTIKHTTKDLYHYIRTSGGLSYIGFNPRKLKILDKVPHLRQIVSKTGEKAEKYFNSWEFLLLFEFIFYLRKVDKEKHKIYKNRARELLKDYKSVRHEYRPFRRYVNFIFWLV